MPPIRHGRCGMRYDALYVQPVPCTGAGGGWEHNGVNPSVGELIGSELRHRLAGAPMVKGGQGRVSPCPRLTVNEGRRGVGEKRQGSQAYVLGRRPALLGRRGPEEREAWAEKCFSFSKMNY